MIVEDEADVLLTMQGGLELNGYEVAAPGNARHSGHRVRVVTVARAMDRRDVGLRFAARVTELDVANHIICALSTDLERESRRRLQHSRRPKLRGPDTDRALGSRL